DSLPGGVLPDGNYTADTGRVTDLYGNTMTSYTSPTFFVLTADANRDRTVDTIDFNLLATNFAQSGKTFSQGDFNYDTVVDTIDFNLLASKFATTVPAPAASATPAADFGELSRAARPDSVRSSLFSNQPLIQTEDVT